MATQFMRVLRPHLPFVVIVPLLVIGMTWPTFVKVFDTSELWLPRRDIDINMLFWDAWYFKRLLAGQADFYYTYLKFHPEGASLAYHNFTLPHMALFAGLQAFLPPFNAFNLTYLILVYLTILSGYIYLYYLFRDRWIALFGAVVFGAGGFVLMRPGQVSTSFIAGIPLTLYFFQRGILEERRLYMLIAGCLVGASAFIGLYVQVCLLLTLAIFTLVFARSRWRDGSFWQSMIMFCLIAAALTFVRIVPMVADPAGLADALNKTGGREYDNDLLAYFAYYPNLITGPIFERVFGPDPGLSEVYLGYTVILLVIFAIAGRQHRNEKLLWLALLIFFLVMRLGSTLKINGVQYENILLPKYFLTEWLPQLFYPFWSTDDFYSGALLPLAVLASFGLTTILRSFMLERHRRVILILLALVAIEYYHGPDPKIIPKRQFAFIDWLKTEPDQASIHLINLPMGGQNSKYYDFHQTMTGYPQVEGRPTRTPDSAFRYIEDNALLSAWRGQLSYHCLPGNRADYHAALDQLLADNFSHILLHKWRALKVVHLHRFAGVAPAYDDHFVTIYRVKDLRGGCENTALIDLGPRFILWDRLGPESNLPESGAAVLSIHPDGAGGLSEYYEAAAARPQQVLPIADADLGTGRKLDREMQRYDPNTILESSSVFLLVYNPRHSAPDRLETYREWLSGRLKLCGRESPGAEAILEYFLDADYSCALLMDGQPRQVAYENGIELGNMHYEVAGDRLELQLLWRSLPEETHSISVQFVDGEGARVGGQDFVIGHEPLARYVIDLSGLETGVYVAKLILYNFETLASAPGRLTGSDQRFERELELAQFERQPID